jgi:hypothetical protein
MFSLGSRPDTTLTGIRARFLSAVNLSITRKPPGSGRIRMDSELGPVGGPRSRIIRSGLWAAASL